VDYAVTATSELQIDLGAVEPGEWTAFVFEMQVHTGASGYFRVTRSTGGCNSPEDCPMSQVHLRSGQSFGFNLTSWFPAWRSYKAAWNHRTNTIPGPDQFMCFDEFRFGDTDISTIYNDVHPFYMDSP
jgi:hypothetical protein